MSRQFEFRLQGGTAPEGELDAGDLVAIVQALREIATKIGRVETDAQPLGRPPKRVVRVAQLTIALAPGSTRLLARRTGAGAESLDFDLADEASFDEKFETLVDAIAIDQRPAWVGDSLAMAAADLAAALQHAAPEVEFSVDGHIRRSFQTSAIHRDTWHVDGDQLSERATFIGRLYAVNLNTHRLQVQDDVGNQVALPKVPNDAETARFLGAQVIVTGSAEVDSRGHLTHLHDATIELAPDPLRGAAVPDVVTLDEILAHAVGIEPGAIEGLTESESDAFFGAIGL